jgi:hypothetical protein
VWEKAEIAAETMGRLEKSQKEKGCEESRGRG